MNNFTKSAVKEKFFATAGVLKTDVLKGSRDSLFKEETKVNVYSTKSLSISQTKLFHETIASDSSDFIKIRANRIAPKVVKDEIENVIITSHWILGRGHVNEIDLNSMSNPC